MKSFLILLIASVSLVSCRKDVIRGTGSVSTRTLSIPAFTRVEAHYDIDAVITYGNVQEVKVTGYENLLDILELELDQGILRLKFSNRYRKIKNSNIRFEIMVPAIQGAAVYGSGDITVKGFLSGNALTTGIYGSGSVSVLESAFENATIDIYGSGRVNAEGLQSRYALVNIYGSGNSYISVSDRLVSKIFGSGNVYYRGNPAIETSINGSGRVIRY